ncbi:hypothetical protein M9H77_35245 [Catharanthus roseus]|uniref:Uncharacterized protein n=1 Tax=Catharanthus roseus TaxID=4058 RepID=A0ACB9ZS50_CATRO|nr:hypothetical protein M9H77_35245 [Catharanthus roseus]
MLRLRRCSKCDAMDFNLLTPTASFSAINVEYAFNEKFLQPWLPLHHQAFSKLSSRASMVKHSRLTRTDPVVISNVSGNILAKIILYCKHVVTQPPTSDNDIELKVFVSKLVNDDEQTLFGLLVGADYLNIKGFFVSSL